MALNLFYYLKKSHSSTAQMYSFMGTETYQNVLLYLKKKKKKRRGVGEWWNGKKRYYGRPSKAI